MLNLDILKNYLNDYKIDLKEEQLAKLSKYYDMVVDTNSRFNLTTIVEENDFIIKHLVDSLVGILEIPNNSILLDIGSGAGFPAVPIAIARDDVLVTALDSTAKKMSFINDVAKSLDLANIKTISGRAEDQTKLFNTFDVITARAVSSLNILLELAIPLLKINGIFIAYKTDGQELESISHALKELNAILLKSVEISLPNGDPRSLLIFKKKGNTPKQYPRQYGTIKKRPL